MKETIKYMDAMLKLFINSLHNHTKAKNDVRQKKWWNTIQKCNKQIDRDSCEPA